MKNLFLLLTTSLTLSLSTLADTFTTLGYAVKDLTQKHVLKTESGHSKVELLKMNFSKKHAVPEDRTVILGHLIEETFTPIASATIPEEIKNALLVFQPSGEGSELPYKVTVVDFSMAKLPLGTSLYLNHSSKQVKAKFGNIEKDLAPGTSAPVADKDIDAEGNRYYAYLSLIHNGVSRPFSKNFWTKDAKTRRLSLISEDPKTKRLSVVTFPDNGSK